MAVVPFTGGMMLFYWYVDTHWPEFYKRWIKGTFELVYSTLGISSVLEIIGGAIDLLFVPVMWALSLLTFHVLVPLGLPRPLEVLGQGGYFAVAWILTVMFWTMTVSRGLGLLGLYNPFWTSDARKRGIVLQAVLRFRDWWEGVTRFGKEPTAKWASLMEVISHHYCAGDIFLGRPKLLAGGMMRPVGIRTEKHFVTIGQTGSGKSSGSLIPNLCLHEGSLLCIDVKGELARITWARRCYGLDQDTYIVDPYRLVSKGGSDCYNPFDEMAKVAENDAERAISYAAKIAQALVKSMSEKETYWDNAARTLLRGLILYIFAYEPEDRRNLLRLRQLVMEGDIDSYNEAVKAGVIEKESAFDMLMAQMMSKRKDGVYGDAISAAAGSIAMMGAGQQGSVVTTAQEHTAFLDTPEIRRVCEKSDFLLQDYLSKKMSVYLVTPLFELKGAQGRWLRMFVLLFTDMMERAGQMQDPPVLLALDEYPALGRLEGIDPSTMRSFGVRFWAIAQDIAQLKEAYPESWTSFIGGAEAVQFIGMTHPATVEFIMERLGMQEVKRKRGYEVRPLFDADQVSKFLAKEKKNQIVWFGSKRPMKLKLCPYYEYLPWWYYAADPRYKEKGLQSFWRALRGRS